MYVPAVLLSGTFKEPGRVIELRPEQEAQVHVRLGAVQVANVLTARQSIDRRSPLHEFFGVGKRIEDEVSCRPQDLADQFGSLLDVLVNGRCSHTGILGGRH